MSIAILQHENKLNLNCNSMNIASGLTGPGYQDIRQITLVNVTSGLASLTPITFTAIKEGNFMTLQFPADSAAPQVNATGGIGFQGSLDWKTSTQADSDFLLPATVQGQHTFELTAEWYQGPTGSDTTALLNCWLFKSGSEVWLSFYYPQNFTTIFGSIILPLDHDLEMYIYGGSTRYMV